MTWIELTVALERAPEDWAPWIEIFREAGIEGTLQVDSPPGLVGYAPDEATALSVERRFAQTDILSVTRREVPEEDWAETWKQFFVPRRVGERLIVRPAWETAELKPGDIEIVVDPGQSFGTGDHPTTRLCLEYLEQAMRPGLEVADVGCGTGILAIAAAKLGTGRLVATDIDAVAVESCRANLIANGVSGEVLQGAGFEPIEGQSFDLVTSNLISAVLMRLAPSAVRAVRPGGAWIVSGIIAANWPEVDTAIQSAGFTLEDHRQEGEWIAARFRR